MPTWSLTAPGCGRGALPAPRLRALACGDAEQAGSGHVAEVIV
jgi:hypothetical protein